MRERETRVLIAVEVLEQCNHAMNGSGMGKKEVGINKYIGKHTYR